MNDLPAAEGAPFPTGLASPRVGGARLAGAQLAGMVGEDLYQRRAIAALVDSALRRMRAPFPTEVAALQGLVRPGDRVVLKPNLLREAALSSGEWRHVVTHPAVIGAVVDQVGPLLEGRGEIVIADGPQTDASFAAIRARTGLTELASAAERRFGVPVRVLDLRQEEWTTRDGVVVARQPLGGDPRGYVDVDLGERSAFRGHDGQGHYYGASFDAGETNREHRTGRHRYRLSGTVMACDLLINLPKLKTHKKAGITASLKNLVGVNGNKNWLPHYTLRRAGAAGDQYPPGAARATEATFIHGGKVLLDRYPRLARPLLPLKRLGRTVFGGTDRVIRSGNWYGNDTLWRMVLDLNRAVLWHDEAGQPRSTPRRYLTLIDAVLAGDGAGPEDPVPRPLGWLLAATNPVAADAVAASLMGFAWGSIPCIAQGFDASRHGLSGCAASRVRLMTESGTAGLDFLPPDWITVCQPHFGWQGHLVGATPAHAHI